MTSKVYVLVHTCLSPIQRGIQGAHAVAELMLHAADDGNPHIWSWAKKDKTLIFLEAGFSKQIKDWTRNVKKLDIPHAIFREDRSTLDGIQTSLAFLLDDETITKCEDETGIFAAAFDRKHIFQSKLHEFIYNLKRLKKA